MFSGWAPGPFAVDYEQRIDLDALRQKRVSRATTVLRDAGLDALLVWKDENVRYLTSFRPQLIAGKSGLLNGVVLLGDGHLVLFASGGDFDRVKERMSWIDEVYPIPILEEVGLIEHFVSQILSDVVRRHRLTQANVGLDIASQALHAALLSHYPQIHWADGDAVMQRTRQIKFPEEITLLQEAVAIADTVTETAIESIRPGIREIEVAGEAMRVLYRLGGESSPHLSPRVNACPRRHGWPPTRLSAPATLSSWTSGPCLMATSEMWGEQLFAGLHLTPSAASSAPSTRRI